MLNVTFKSPICLKSINKSKRQHLSTPCPLHCAKPRKNKPNWLKDTLWAAICLWLEDCQLGGKRQKGNQPFGKNQWLIIYFGFWISSSRCAMFIPSRSRHPDAKPYDYCSVQCTWLPGINCALSCKNRVLQGRLGPFSRATDRPGPPGQKMSLPANKLPHAP